VYIKYCLQKKNISAKQRLFLTDKLNRLGNVSSISKIRNRCAFTGKARSINQCYKLARMPFREVLSLGLVPGFKKAVW
jgi:ribosomal protein S14